MKAVYKIKTQFTGHGWNWVDDGYGEPALFEMGHAYETAKNLAQFCNVRVYKGSKIVWTFVK